MPVDLLHSLNALRVLVKKEFQMAFSDARQCKILLNLIVEKTDRSLTELALSRFLGLAPSILPPSKYTLDTLSAFCGFKNWEDFTKKN